MKSWILSKHIHSILIQSSLYSATKVPLYIVKVQVQQLPVSLKFSGSHPGIKDFYKSPWIWFTFCIILYAISFYFFFWSFQSFYTVHQVLMTSILGWFPLPSSSGSRFVRTLHYDLSILGGMAWLIVSRDRQAPQPQQGNDL